MDVLQLAKEVESYVIAIRLDMHLHLEVSMEETRTIQLVVRELEKMNITYEIIPHSPSRIPHVSLLFSHTSIKLPHSPTKLPHELLVFPHTLQKNSHISLKFPHAIIKSWSRC